MWFNDGIWWGNLWDTASSDFEIFRFNASTNTWTSTGVTTDTRANTHHDVLWDGKTLFVASYRFVNDGLPAEANFPTTMRRYSYNASTKTYSSLGSSQINNQRTETLSIDKDSTGRVWATWQQGNRIYMNVTRTDGSTWETSSGFPHPASSTNVSVDDNSAVIAFGGKIGVMWSRQVGDATDGMYWSYRPDTAAWNTGWTVPVAAVKGQRSGDDHMNLKWLDASSDKVFAAIKTSYTSSSQPLIQLLALDASTSAWTAHTIATVAECPNRVIVMIDESTSPATLRTFATYPKPTGTTNAGVCTSSGGAIYEKSASVGNISFSSAKTPLIVDADQYVHNVTSTKQNLNSQAWGTLNSGVLLLADVNATSRYWHHYQGGAGSGGGGGTTDTTPPTVTPTSPAANATAVSLTSDVTATFSEAMSVSTVQSAFTLKNATSTVSASVSLDSTGKVATLNPTADLSPGTTYTASISTVAKDLGGNALTSPVSWNFTTAATTPPPAGGTTVTLTAIADSYVLSGSTSNFGSSTLLAVDGSPVTTTYLKFDLTSYADKTITGATLQLRSSTSGSTGTQNVKHVADDGWTETGITYSNRPALGSTVGSFGSTATNTDRSITLAVDALNGDLGPFLSLGLDSSSSDGLDLNSKEVNGGQYAPKLVLTFQ
ncbi:Ig-like domain-containing protein [Arthrobacter sp. MPF02]|uniref:Ig-like domain-containing protein n=1 Tax=Arthrobacter sp. MPF02 TaxID=3388492 RepID=UPI0039855B77